MALISREPNLCVRAAAPSAAVGRGQSAADREWQISVLQRGEAIDPSRVR
jgi:hypothetical protein